MTEVNDMTATRGEVQTARPCHRCMVCSEELPFSYEYQPRTHRSITCTRQAHTQLKEEGAWLKAHGKQSQARVFWSLLPCLIILVLMKLSMRSLSNLFIICIWLYRSLSKLVCITACHHTRCFLLPVKKLRRKILRGCKDLLACYERESYITGL